MAVMKKVNWPQCWNCVFYKVVSGVITRVGLSKKMPIISVLLNVINIIEQAGKAKRSALLVAMDFKKAFDSINHQFIDSCPETFNFVPSSRAWVKLFFNGRDTYLLMHGYTEDKIRLEQGVPQGDILFPLIFNIVVQFFLLKIGFPHKISGGEWRSTGRGPCRRYYKWDCQVWV